MSGLLCHRFRGSVSRGLVLLAMLGVLAACSKQPEPKGVAAVAPSAPTNAAGIDWLHAANDVEVDAAFDLARQQDKPVFVYWGAAWCPPCNQLKATLFNRADFIERSRAFVPVYVDGDSAGAQKLGTRFNVRGYPTTVLFDSKGTEITRLPGEVDPQAYTEVLTLGMAAQRPVKEVLAQARAGGAALSANDWRMLAFYSWETDPGDPGDPGAQADGVPGLAALLKQLAQACPPDQDDTATRLWLKALAAVDAKTTKPDGASLPRLRTLLADPVRARRVMDILTNNAADLARALTARGTPERSSLLAALDTALLRLADDTTLSRADRLTALIGRVDLVRIDVGETVQVAVPAPLLDALRAQSSRADREISDGYERLAVIPTAAYGLAQAGRVDESDALLQANLVKSHSPYYLMSALASNAKRRNDSVAALRWSQQAFDSSVGAATRLQWGAAYVSLLVELAPQNEARIESAVQQVWALAGEQPDAFHERSARSLQRIGKRLGAWNKDGAHKAAVARLQTGLDAACARLDRGDPQRASCEAVMRLSGGKAA